MVRAKFRVSHKDESNVELTPVYDGNKENEEFFQTTPSGLIQLYILNKPALDYFEVGKSYYIDFTEASTG